LLIGAAVVLLVAFVVIESRSKHPLLPLRVLVDRNRGGAFIASLLVGIAMFATFLFLTYYFQGTLGYSALRTGFAFLPFSLGIITGATLSSRLLPRVGPRWLMVFGFTLAAIGLALFTGIGLHTDYLTHILIAEVIVSFGMGTAFVPLSSTALLGVDPSDAGVASAMVNTTQQTGASLGVALLNTLAATATANYLLHHGKSPASYANALVHGYTTSFTVSAVLLALAAVSTILILRAKRSDLDTGEGLEAVPVAA
jgi:predicted MFS family arabinose efflux permease